ncbi:MAG: helix-turn-helix domain-containing protein [Bacillus sp. (in: Bacteria)]|nr:helix-turn-helix domain-containing protein [Bacillus sp. (in: firmicutes)]
MLQIESIILFCLKQLNSERTIYSIYHLLNGKKSSQTIQDVHLFSLKRFFGIYEPLTRESFDEIIQAMLEKEWIYRCGVQRYHLMPSGNLFLEKYSLPAYINGWDFHQFTTLFWERLSIFIQVTSNLVFEETKYTPIQRNKDVHLWLKSVLKKIFLPKKEISEHLYSELIKCFDESKEIDPSLLVFRLTGFQQIGLTPNQVAKKLNMNRHDYHIGFINALHYLIQKIERESNHYKILFFLIEDIKQSDELTLSARKTRNLLNKGYSLEMIARFRHLKLSTIEDHLVEFALNIDGFPIDTYVDKELQMRILGISRLSSTRELKLIKEKLTKVTYFQIRLVMAKYGER